ncbi:MAG: hypothetical protein C0433_14400 [Cyclobacterium sp.]|nr:hypothetical protein [Cyclobacterium sp.]
MQNQIQDYDKKKPEKKLWVFSIVLISASSSLFIALYEMAVTNDSLAIPFLCVAFCFPFMFLIEILFGFYFNNDSWRLRDIYRFRAFLIGKYLGFVFVFGVLFCGMIGGIKIKEPILYGLHEIPFFTNFKLDFQTAQAVHRSYVAIFFASYFAFVHYIILNLINKKAVKLTYGSITIPNKPSEYQEKGFFTTCNRFFGEKYLNVNGELIRSKELEDWLTEISTDSYKWPKDDFIPSLPLEKFYYQKIRWGSS